MSRAMEGAQFLTPEGWSALLAEAGFGELHSEVSHLTARSQLASDLSGQSWRDIAGRFRAMGAFLHQYLTDADVRHYSRTLMPSRRTMRDLFRYYGYGIYTGRRVQ